MTQLPVADSFILGLAHGYRIPLCITRGYEKREDTPLYDQDFSRAPNPATSGNHLFIQYPVHLRSHSLLERILQERLGFSGPKPPSDFSQGPPPSHLPVLKTESTQLPGWLDPERLPRLPYGYRGGGVHLLLSSTRDLVDPLPDWLESTLRLQDVCVKVQKRSGAVTLAWMPRALAADTSLREHLLSEDLLSLLAGIGVGEDQWIGPGPGTQNVKRLRPRIESMRMMIDGMKTAKALGNFSESDIDRYTKCRYTRLNAWIQVQGIPVRVYGEGNEWLLGGCPRRQSSSEEAPPIDNVCQSKIPAQFSLSWVGRQIFEDSDPLAGQTNLENQTKLKSPRRARREAIRRLGPLKKEYQKPTYRWGYKAAPVHCTQDRMYLVYLFDFLPRDDERYRGNLPITIEIPAHWLPPGKRIEDDWVCDPEVPKAEGEPEG